MEDILDILEDNARVSLEDLSKLTGKTIQQVNKTIKDYEKKGVIVKYKTIVNKNKIKGEKNVVAIIEVKVVPQKDVGFDLVAERIYRFSEVRSCHLLSGTYDLLLVVEGKDINAVANFVSSKLAPLKEVRGTTTHFMLKTYKDNGVILVNNAGNKRLPITY